MSIERGSGWKGASRGVAAATVVALSALGWSCGREPSPTPEPEPGRAVDRAAEPLRVTVTTPVLRWLVERLGGASVRVSDFGAEALELDFVPSAEQVLAASESDRIVTRGRRLEPWLETVSLPSSRLVEAESVLASDGLNGLIEREGPTHSHGNEGEHSHRTVVPGATLAPGLFAREAEHLAEALVALAEASDRADLASSVRERASLLADELAALDERYRGLGELARRAGIEVCSAPAGGVDYACRALELPLRSFDPPTAGRELVLWPLGVPDPPMSTESIVVPIDPIERRTSGAGGLDYLGRQRANLERLALALESGAP